MRALAVFPERRELKVIDVPAPPRPRDREVTVRIRQVGICGTDREISTFKYGTPPPGSDRLVLGHEAMGEVVEVGPRVRTLARGDLVALTVRRPCDDPTCVACRAGRQDFCVSGAFTERGIKGADGFMTELVVEDEKYVVPVPDRLAEVGVLTEPLTVAAKAAIDLDAILRRYPWEPFGLRALVLGAGPIGLLSAMMLVARPAKTFIYSREAANGDRAELARSFGAEYVSAGDTPLSDLPTRIGKIDIIFEAVGTARVAFGALRALAGNGVFILSGFPSAHAPIEIDLDAIMRDIVLKNQVMFGTVNASRGAFEAAVRQLEQDMGLFPKALRSLITHRVKLEDVPEILRRPSGIKQVVELAA